MQTALAASILSAIAIKVGWYTLVACVFFAEHPRAAYLRPKTLIDRITGSVMAAPGPRLIMSSLRPG